VAYERYIAMRICISSALSDGSTHDDHQYIDSGIILSLPYYYTRPHYYYVLLLHNYYYYRSMYCVLWLSS
jgi:hypothetical protein